MPASGSISDPYYLIPLIESVTKKSTIGKTPSNPRLVGGQRNDIFLVFGQSRSSCYGTGTYTPTNTTKIDNLNLWDGGMYQGADPFLGCGGLGGSWMGQLADGRITNNKADRVIFIPFGYGGSQIANWEPGGILHAIVPAAIKRTFALGLTPTAVLWQQGESDTATSSATWQASFAALKASVVGYGVSAPWFVAKSTMLSNVVNPVIQGAQVAVVNGSSVYAGPDIDQFTGVTNLADGTHMTLVGNTSAGGVWNTAISLVL